MNILIDEGIKAGGADSVPKQWHVEINLAVARRGWALATNREEFARSVCDELAAKFEGEGGRVTANAIERATVHQYCFVLHDACASADPAVQRRAFEELWKHLYRVGIYHTRDKERAKDSAQQALINIWRHLDQCRDKGSFLNWCNLIVLNVIRGDFRKESKHTSSGAAERWEREEISVAEVGNPGEDLRGELGDSDYAGEPHAFDVVAQQELQKQLVAAIRACLDNEDQQKVVVGCFLHDKNYKELSEWLHTTPGNIQVMKSRALKKLRRCAAFVRLYEEWLNV